MTTYREIPYQDPVDVFVKIKQREWPMLLHSADHATLHTANRYSYLVCDPVEKFILEKGNWVNHAKKSHNPFAELAEFFTQRQEVVATLPPFQGGLMGYLSYDLCHYLEKVSLPATDYTNFPEMAFGLYDAVISFDHLEKKAWIVATELVTCADARIQALEELIAGPTTTLSRVPFLFSNDIRCNFTHAAYLEAVREVQRYILEGDVFEVNLAQCFVARLCSQADGFDLYQTLLRNNPAPFSAYLKLGAHEIISASPERFLRVDQRRVEARPIKGTIRRGATQEEDQFLAQTLASSEKDQAENVMIVDLMRNDLSKVCAPHSVKVTQLCGVESFATVHHLVSHLEGRLKSECSTFDLLQACFPGGSITGAPKVRAMQIISALEPNRRSVYCGNLGWINFQGDMDLSIVIRTFLRHQNTLSFQAGGAIVLQSDPEEEYKETLLKAQALKQALTVMEAHDCSYR